MSIEPTSNDNQILLAAKDELYTFQSGFLSLRHADGRFEPIHVDMMGNRPTSAVSDAAGRFLFVGLANGCVAKLAADLTLVDEIFTGRNEPVLFVLVSRDDRLVAGYAGGFAMVWNTQKPMEAPVTLSLGKRLISAVGIKDNTAFLFGLEDKTIKQYSAADLAFIREFKSPVTPQVMAASKFGVYFYVAGEKKTAVFDRISGELLGQFEIFQAAPVCLAADEGGKWIVVADADDKISVFSVKKSAVVFSGQIAEGKVGKIEVNRIGKATIFGFGGQGLFKKNLDLEEGKKSLARRNIEQIEHMRISAERRMNEEAEAMNRKMAVVFGDRYLLSPLPEYEELTKQRFLGEMELCQLEPYETKLQHEHNLYPVCSICFLKSCVILECGHVPYCIKCLIDAKEMHWIKVANQMIQDPEKVIVMNCPSSDKPLKVVSIVRGVKTDKTKKKPFLPKVTFKEA